MKIRFLPCFLFCLLVSFAEAADIGNYTIPLDVTIHGKVVPAAAYTIRVESDSVQIVKGGEVIASETAILLPSAGDNETTITVVETKKQSYVRIRIRHDSSWYIVYLPVTKQTALSTQNS